MVAHPWILKMGNQVSHNLKHSLSLPLPLPLQSSTTTTTTTKRKPSSSPDPQTKKKKQTIGILSFEVANVMSKLVHLHKSTTDAEITKLKTELLTRSSGLKLLTISPDHETYLLDLACAEKLDDLTRAAEAVSRLGKRCSEPALQGFEHVFADLVSGVIHVRELGFLVKDMDAMVRRMERYVSATANLYGELEVLNELEQTSRKFQQNHQLEETRRAVEQKLSWQRQDVRQLQDVSLWNQTYDKIVELLARTICTLFARIRVAFDGAAGLNPSSSSSSGGGGILNLNLNPPPAAASASASGGGSFLSFGISPPRKREDEKDEAAVDIIRPGRNKNHNSKDHKKSGPLVVEKTKSPSFKQPITTRRSSNRRQQQQQQQDGIIKRAQMEFFHGPDYSLPCAPTPGSFIMECFSLSNLASKVDDDDDRDSVYYYNNDDRSSSSSSPKLQSYDNHTSTPTNQSSSYMINSPCLSSESGTTTTTPYRQHQHHHQHDDSSCSTSGSLFGSNSRLARHATPSTIGGSALALHYANVIIVIEKLLRYPHLIGEEARDDLYQMLPSSLRKLLKLKLKTYFNDVAIYDASVAHDWKEKLDGVLTWLAPLAHNMIRWQSERNFEQQQIVKRTNVLLLQTLYFADRARTEAAVCELLLGLNYICRYEQQQNALLDCGSFDFGDWMEWQLQCHPSSC